MDGKKMSELRIDGIGNSSGGQFFKVNINGRGKIVGSLECTQFSCNGIAYVDGDLHAEKAEINGVLTTEKNINADELSVYGKTNIHGSVTSNQLRVEGDLSVDRDVKANHFHSRGRIHVNGLLQAKNVQMTIYGMSRFTDIHAETVHVKRGFKDINFIMKMISRLPKLRADTIEADDVYLEYTQANTVRGKNVSIGPGCIIKTVEYGESYHQDKESEISHIEQVVNL